MSKQSLDEKPTYPLLVAYEEDNDTILISCMIGAFTGGHLLTALIVFYESVCFKCHKIYKFSDI